MSLSDQKCKACTKETPVLSESDIQALMKTLDGWRLADNHIERDFSFKNFKEALAFTNKIAALAEEEGHHPDIYLSWGKVKITLWTHKIGGLSKNDFILAAKIDTL